MSTIREISLRFQEEVCSYDPVKSKNKDWWRNGTGDDHQTISKGSQGCSEARIRQCNHGNLEGNKAATESATSEAERGCSATSRLKHAWNLDPNDPASTDPP
jgi:hypothetical protein